ncbi:1-acyl-sn-glycerol-3-phosphate acyltransferase, partial [Burkholderia sp. Cy-647]|nr:1-acyl-sn-glycerol-3-phosphate acyltransferase [Burkholderia sp. Cy-647]
SAEALAQLAIDEVPGGGEAAAAPSASTETAEAAVASTVAANAAGETEPVARRDA